MSGLVEQIVDLIAKIEDPGEQANPAAKDVTAELLQKMDALKQRTRELAARTEEIACGVIQLHGDIVIGDIRYYVGEEKRTKCIDKPGTLEAVLTAKCGDFGAVCDMLASDPFKYGAVRTAIGDDAFNKLFTQDKVIDLKTGKPLRSLQKLDGRFIRKAK